MTFFLGISALMTDDTYALHKWADNDAMTFASAVGVVIVVDFCAFFPFYQVCLWVVSQTPRLMIREFAGVLLFYFPQLPVLATSLLLRRVSKLPRSVHGVGGIDVVREAALLYFAITSS